MLAPCELLRASGLGVPWPAAVERQSLPLSSHGGPQVSLSSYKDARHSGSGTPHRAPSWCVPLGRECELPQWLSWLCLGCLARCRPVPGRGLSSLYCRATITTPGHFRGSVVASVKTSLAAERRHLAVHESLQSRFRDVPFL